MKELPFRKVVDGVNSVPPDLLGAYAAIDRAYRSALELKRLSLENNILASHLAGLAKKLSQAESESQAEAAQMSTWLANRRHLTDATNAFGELIARAKESESLLEQIRLATEAEARRVAAEQARVAVERKTLEAREQEEARAKRRAEQDAKFKVFIETMESLEAAKVNRPYPVSGSAAATGPVFTVAAGRLATSAATTLSVKTALEAGVAAVIAAGTASASAVVVGFAALLFPSPLGNGESRQLNVPLSDLLPDKLHAWNLSLSDYEPDSIHALSVPLSALINTDLNALNAVIAADGEIEMPVAIGSRTVGSTTEFVVATTNGTTVPGKLPVRLATYDPSINAYRSYNPDTPSIGMTWTPVVKPNNASTSLPQREPNIVVYDRTTLTALEGRIDTHPELDLYSFGGFITVFPTDSGIPPTFTMFRDRRSEPGIASGSGELVSGNWLGAIDTAEGAPIPMQIADRLRGMEFSSFKAFRRAFWKAVANEQLLMDHFTQLNKIDMRDGWSPSALPSEQVGGRKKYEIHHIKPISEGGSVYDVDNFRVLMPKQHIDTHSKKGE